MIGYGKSWYLRWRLGILLAGSSRFRTQMENKMVATILFRVYGQVDSVGRLMIGIIGVSLCGL